MISRSAQLIAESQAARSQAESATRTAEELLKNSAKTETKDTDETTEDLVKCLKVKDDEIQSLNKNLNTAKLDLDVMKKQSESISREYDNLLKEHDKLQSRLEKLENSSNESKKEM